MIFKNVAHHFLPCTPFFSIGLVKSESDSIVRSVETDLGRWTLVVAVISVDAYPFLTFLDLTCPWGYRNKCFLVALCCPAFEIQVLSMSAIKCLGNFRFFHFTSVICQGNKLPKTQQKPLYITSAIALACLGILPRAMIWFFNSWDYLLYQNYIIYL